MPGETPNVVALEAIEPVPPSHEQPKGITVGIAERANAASEPSTNLFIEHASEPHMQDGRAKSPYQMEEPKPEPYTPMEDGRRSRPSIRIAD